MCGIVGYNGYQEAERVLLEGLHRLEYRGYDSVGLAIIPPDGQRIQMHKFPGKLSQLNKDLLKFPFRGKVGIGHTRWATHGIPSRENAHPHLDCRKKIAVVHNGIIENFYSLREELMKEGHHFRSETDTEVIPHLLEKYYEGDLLSAVRRTLERLKGAYALGIITLQEPDKMIAVRKDSPLIIGLGEKENFLASDVPAILSRTRKVIYLQEGDIALIYPDRIEIFDTSGKKYYPPAVNISWDINVAEKGGFPHFMLKEIHEQTSSFRNTLRGRISPNKDHIIMEEIGMTDEELKNIDRIYVVACGTAYHAGLVGKRWLEDFARLPVETEMASEFRYRDPIINPQTLVVAISQSGETADTIASMREARLRGARILTVCNVVGSTLTRECEGVIYTHAGIEIGVASTKAYTSQLAVMCMLALHMAWLKEKISSSSLRSLIQELENIPALLTSILKDTSQIEGYSKKYHRFQHFLYLGRGYNYPSALEGALKLKEISYIHAEGYGAGEMKHGPIALIDNRMPTLGIVVPGKVYDKMLGNLQEIRARRGKVLIVGATEDNSSELPTSDIIHIPPVSEPLSPITVAVPLQLFAYFVGVKRDCNVDQPRNLAKSVTVE